MKPMALARLPAVSYKYAAVQMWLQNKVCFDEAGFNEEGGVSISATVSASANIDIQKRSLR